MEHTENTKKKNTKNVIAYYRNFKTPVNKNTKSKTKSRPYKIQRKTNHRKY